MADGPGEITVTVDGADVPLTFGGVIIPEVGDIELPRVSMMSFTDRGSLP